MPTRHGCRLAWMVGMDGWHCTGAGPVGCGQFRHEAACASCCGITSRSLRATCLSQADSAPVHTWWPRPRLPVWIITHTWSHGRAHDQQH